MAAIARRVPTDGAAIEDARTRLQELDAKLETTLVDSLCATRTALHTKKSVLNRFTITLFGRTMAGKSTIRETLTGGDGTTIGKGAQRTTRDVREYVWNSLRIIDTPGIGAYEGEEDRAQAISVIDETDVVLFLVSSDGVQEESFKGMRELRQQNKPIIFVLNIKRDLEKSVNMRRFLKDPRSIFNENEIRGHFDRICELARDYLGMSNVEIYPIHAQAAYFSTRPEYKEDAELLADYSRLGKLLHALEVEVSQRGIVRRLQTIIDGTQISLLDLQEELGKQAKTVRQVAHHLKDKFEELDAWLNGFIRATKTRVETEASQLVQPLRASLSAFIDENIERKDVGERWNQKVVALDIQGWLKRQQTVILDELRACLDEFSREMSVKSKVIGEFDTANPSQFDPWDVKRSLHWLSAAGGAMASVSAVAGYFGAANFWNPIGLTAGVISVIPLGLSWFFNDREKKLQGQKAKVTSDLRKNIDNLEREVASSLKKWFYDSVTSRLVRAIRKDTRQFYTGMGRISRSLDDGARQVATIVEGLNRRLLVRTGQFIHMPVEEALIARVVRDPGVRIKFLWRGNIENAAFCKEVGRAINEWVDEIPEVPVAQKIAAALRPANVLPTNVSISARSALVRVPQKEVGRAIGKRGSNISLASRLVDVRIKVIGEDRAHV
ncbi:GTPase [Bombella saccharophila]|uniref:50S ribosome-binding GTPase n=1 Tax=Bombella saccharophila TaxID=2967338 RepID=A0ABT3W8X7_9PROT|nr:GTPase [Bombella saccharophila]MCX5614098.1 50S ribosome-binding GTPase [Bombella saccharophila]